MKNITLTVLAAAAIALTSAFAGPVQVPSKNVKNVVKPEVVEFFRDQEFQVDAFYSQLFRAPNVRRINTGAGGGIALNYIFARYFGVGIENSLFSNNRNAPYHLGGYGILRYPIEAIRLAPYALVGGGFGLGRNSYGYGNVGGGLEFRFTPNIGIFSDWRWIYGGAARGSDFRAGLRYSF